MAIKPAPAESMFFVSISLNVSALLRFREAMESSIDELSARASGWADPTTPSGQAVLFHDGLVQSLLPITLRSAFLVAVWSLYESTVIEIAKFVSAELKLVEFSIKNRFFSVTEAYYRDVLAFERDSGDEVTSELRFLYELRNAIAHGGGRQGAVSTANWDKLSSYLAQRADFSLARGVVELSDDLVDSASNLVADAVNRLVSEARGVLAKHRESVSDSAVT
jgi:hypothetical protein